MRIRTHLALMVVAVLVPVVLAAAIAVDHVRQGKREAALESLNETVRATSLLIDREVQGSLSALQALGNSENLRTNDIRAFYEQAKAIDKPPDVWTSLLDETGVQVLNTVVPFGTPAPPAAALYRVTEALSTQQPVVSDLITGPVTGKLLTTIYVPARAGGEKKYVVAQAFAVDHWKRTVLQPKGHAEWIVAVIDRSGKFISRSHRSEELLGKAARPELVAAAARQDAGLIRHSTLEGLDVYDAFAHSQLTGWTIAVAAPVESIESSGTDAIRWLMLGIAGSLCAAALLAVLFGRGLVRAIDEASVAARALGGGGSLQPGRTSLHELKTLNEALSDAASLLSRERESRQSAENERERLLASEIAARSTAQAQNKAKDQFLGMLGHELRSPLAAIASAEEVLQLAGADDEKRAKFLGIIRRQNRHLHHIVDDLLDVSRLLAGKIQLARQPMDLALCVERCMDGLRPTGQAAGYSINVDAHSVWIDADLVRIDQIVINLVTNALKYSAPGSRIDVEVRGIDDLAILRVRDNGAGMSSALLSRIFEPFVQGPPLPERVQSGLGIGLALVRQLVALHGGTIHAHSDGLGQGSLFTVTFQRIADGKPQEATVSRPAALSGRLLLVEDNQDARTSMAELLRTLGHEVVEAGDGAEAIKACVHPVPDIVGVQCSRQKPSPYMNALST